MQKVFCLVANKDNLQIRNRYSFKLYCIVIKLFQI